MIVESDIVWNSEDIRGFSRAGSVSASPSWTYGPKRPLLAYTGQSGRGVGAERLAALGCGQELDGAIDGELVEGRSSGTDAVSSPRLTYGP